MGEVDQRSRSGKYDRKRIGSAGEELAVMLLESKRHRILARNYKTVFGEIDIITRCRNEIHFVEVKTRADDRCGFGAEAVNRTKQTKIERAATVFVEKTRLYNLTMCFDVVDIEIVHLEDSFN